MQKKAGAKLYSILFFALTVLVVFLSIKATNPPAVVKSNSTDTVFSVERAYQHLLQVARMPHTVGTSEHERVKDYIVNTCEQMGLQVRIQNSIEAEIRGNMLVAVNVQNIIAVIRGSKEGKSVLISAHYDTQPNTPGAADDGMGIVSMLETARVIRALPPMPHDIILLFTDGEEEGLFGAKAFLKDSLFKNVGIAMNWDSRGNKGTVITYETSSQNGWIVRQYSKGTKYPVGNSMAYEISKRLPNTVDFKHFKQAGLTGFTNGVIGGYSNYHSMADKPENLDRRSLQQVGDNMLSMAKHIGYMQQLGNTKSADLSYFNVFGYWFVYYPSSLNLPFIIFTTLLFITILFIGIRRRLIRLPGFIIATIALPISMAISYFLSVFVLKRILHHYPLYTHFYGNDSYNSEWYFLTMAMLSLFIFSIIFQPILSKWKYASTFPGILLVCIVIMWAVYIYAPSAIWLFVIPLFFLIAGYGWAISRKTPVQESEYYLLNFVSVLPALLLFSPLIYLMFLSFGLSNAMPLVGLMVVLIAALSYPVLGNAFKNNRWLISLLSFLGIFIALLIAHRNSGFDKKHPLQTNIMYRLNASDSTAAWLSSFTTTDKFSKNFFPDKKIDTSLPNAKGLIHAAPVFSYAPPIATVKTDTTFLNQREVTLFCNSSRQNVNSIGMLIDDETLSSVIGVTINKTKSVEQGNSNGASFNSLIFYGPPPEGFLVKFTMRADAKLGFTLYDQSLGLPVIKGLTEFPQDVIPSPGFNSNIVRVEKNFLF